MHGEAYDLVTGVLGEASYAGAFSSKNDGDGASEVDVVKGGGLRAVGGSDHEDVSFLEVLEGLREVRDLNEGDTGAARDARDGLGHSHGSFSRGDDGVDAGSISGAKASSEVARVLHAIKDEEKGVRGLVEDVREVGSS